MASGVFSGANYLSIADATQTGLDLTGDFTVMTILNKSSAVTGVPWGKWADNGNQRSFRLLTLADGRILFQIDPDGTGGSAVALVSTETLSTGTEYVVTCTYNSGTNEMRAYIDCVEIAASPLTGPGSIFNSTAAFQIGSHIINSGAQSNFFAGDIGYVRVYSRLLSDAERETESNSLTAVSTTNLEASYDLADATDTSANGNDMTNVNSVTFGGADMTIPATCVPAVTPANRVIFFGTSV